MTGTIKPLWAIFVNIFRRLTQRRVAILLVLATAAHAALLFAISASRSDYEEITITILMALALPVASLITAGAALGDEREGGTMPFMLVKPIGRWVVAAAALAASIAAVISVSLLGIGLAWIAGTQATADGGIGWPMLASLPFVAAAYSAVFVPIGLIAKRSTLIGLAFILIWEGIISSAVDTAASASLWRIGLTVYADLADGLDGGIDFLGTLTPGVGGAIAKVGVLLVLSLSITTALLRRRDMA